MAHPLHDALCVAPLECKAAGAGVAIDVERLGL